MGWEELDMISEIKPELECTWEQTDNDLSKRQRKCTKENKGITSIWESSKYSW